MNKRRIVTSVILLILFSLSSSCISPQKEIVPTFVPTAKPTFTVTTEPKLEISKDLKSEKGGQVSLPDGTAVIIPPESLSADSSVSIHQIQVELDESEVISLVGNVYDIDLGEESLQKPIVIEIPYKLDHLPGDVTEDELFLAYFDESNKEWTFAGGVVDKTRHIVAIETDHASDWGIFSWNWNAWLPALTKTLNLDVVDFMEAMNELSEECHHSGKYVNVREVERQNIIQGCIVVDDPLRPLLRVVNPKSFYLGVRFESQGGLRPASTLLAPGGKTEFYANLNDPSPLVVKTEFTQEAGMHLVVDSVLGLLPEVNQLGRPAKLNECLTEQVDKVNHITELLAATNSLINRNGLKAAESLMEFLLNKDAVSLFLDAAGRCGLKEAGTYGVKKIASLVRLSGIIIQEYDYIINYIFNYQRSFEFIWTQLTPTPTLASNSTELPTQTLTPTLPTTPTASSLTLKVVKQANCRYGPGSAYLYAYGLYPDDQPIVLGRNYNGSWIYVNPVDTNIKCWISKDVAEVSGDITQTPVITSSLPHTTEESPPTNILANRNGDTVNITWDQVHVNMTDARGYLIEATLCQNGQSILVVVQTDNTSYEFTDEKGCANPSGGKIFTVNTRGYTDPAPIPWP